MEGRKWPYGIGDGEVVSATVNATGASRAPAKTDGFRPGHPSPQPEHARLSSSPRVRSARATVTPHHGPSAEIVEPPSDPWLTAWCTPSRRCPGRRRGRRDGRRDTGNHRDRVVSRRNRCHRSPSLERVVPVHRSDTFVLSPAVLRGSAETPNSQERSQELERDLPHRVAPMGPNYHSDERPTRSHAVRLRTVATLGPPSCTK